MGGRPRKPCKIDNCNEPHVALGLCVTHYRRNRDRRLSGSEVDDVCAKFLSLPRFTNIKQGKNR